jgi:hypothetical protein
MPPKKQNPHKNRASLQRPPDKTSNNPSKNTTRTNINLGTAQPISSANLLKAVPNRKAPRGYYK